VIPELINAGEFDILVMGTRSYRIQGFDFGTTVNKLRHKISIPLLIVKN
jgi:manganese transport protein